MISDSEEGIGRVHVNEDSAITVIREPLDETNWHVWRHRMSLALHLCGLDAYVTGQITRPNPQEDPVGSANWTFNDTYAKFLITNNITSSQMVHVIRCATAHDMWSNLEAVNSSAGYRILLRYHYPILVKTFAEEGDNISEHLNTLKQYRESISLMGDSDFEVSDGSFKLIIAASLPPSWDTFTEAYVARKDVVDNDLRKVVSSQQFIQILKEEYFRREPDNADPLW
jgi:hypothetical protein